MSANPQKFSSDLAKLLSHIASEKGKADMIIYQAWQGVFDNINKQVHQIIADNLRLHTENQSLHEQLKKMETKAK
jgi:regulator of replication initiation timing